MPWRETSRRVWQAIEISQELGADHEDDIYRLARDLTDYGIPIRHSARFLTIIASMKQHPGCYGALTAEFDTEDWELMVIEGKATGIPHNPLKARHDVKNQ